MKGKEYEKFIRDRLKDGQFTAELTQGSGDRGVDIWAQASGNPPITIAIQAKYYTSQNVGSETIQKTAGLLPRDDVDEAWVTTNSEYTSEAKQVAENRNVTLEVIDPPGQLSTSEFNTQPRSASSGLQCPSCGKTLSVYEPYLLKHWERARCSPPTSRPEQIPPKVWETLVKELDDDSLQPVGGEQTRYSSPYHGPECPSCGKRLQLSKRYLVKHWARSRCDLPASRPDDVSKEIWGEVVDELNG